jgi:hypothetical protein
MVHQRKSKELTCNQEGIQAQNTRNHTKCAHKKLAKQQNNVLKSQITKRDLRSHNKGLHPKCDKIQTLELVLAKLPTKLDYPN